MPETFTLRLLGHVPSKKNQWRPKPGGGIRIDRKTADEITPLIQQAQILWRGRAPLVHPDMDVEFHVRDRRADRDNKLGCLLDVLKKAGVIWDDNAKWFNGTLALKPVVISSNEAAVITMTVKETAGPRRVRPDRKVARP